MRTKTVTIKLVLKPFFVCLRGLFTSNFCFARADKTFVLQTGTGLIYIPVYSTAET